MAGVELDIEPIVHGLLPPESAAPVDLPAGRAGAACRALWFRGLLLADGQRRFRPDAPLTRADFATALAGAVRLVPPEGQPRLPPDVPETAPWAEDVAEVLEARLLELDSEGMFRPAGFVPRQLAAAALTRVWPMGCGEKLSLRPVALMDLADVAQLCRPSVFAAIHAGLLPSDQGYFHPLRPVTRAEAAEAICRLIGLSWEEGGRRPVSETSFPTAFQRLDIRDGGLGGSLLGNRAKRQAFVWVRQNEPFTGQCLTCFGGTSMLADNRSSVQ